MYINIISKGHKITIAFMTMMTVINFNDITFRQLGLAALKAFRRGYQRVGKVTKTTFTFFLFMSRLNGFFDFVNGFLF